jgi:hypothetical protein
MNRLIEDYLRTRGVRYFRGHHDDEYFYLVDFVVGAYRGRLNVHLEAGGADRDTVLISITPDRFFPAERREDLDGLVARWNAGAPPLEAVVHPSSDPRLVGAMAHGCHRPADAAALGEYVDAAVGSAIELFGAMPDPAAGARQTPDTLRDAG